MSNLFKIYLHFTLPFDDTLQFVLWLERGKGMRYKKNYTFFPKKIINIMNSKE